jgi:CBS domain containing-hemolysin-like protein
MTPDWSFIQLAFTAMPPVPRTAGSSDWLILWLSLFLALGVSFLCSLLEAGILSIPGTHVEVMVREKQRGGELLQKLKAEIDRPLAAILTLNTVAHTIGAAGVGAQVLIIFGEAWVAAASAIVTILILVFSEIIPKTLGAAHAKRLAAFTAVATQGLIWITWPIVWMLKVISQRLGGGHATIVTREEIRAVSDLGAREGALDRIESRVIANLLRLHQVRVEDVMTPRTVVFMLPSTITAQEILERNPNLRFSRVPVYGSSPDEIIGIVLRSSILRAAAEGDTRPIGKLARTVHAIPEQASVDDALEQFIARKVQFFLVVDEFGGTSGIISLEDAIETLLGVEIVDETDSIDDMRRLAHRLAEERWAGREGETESEPPAEK